MNRFFRVTLALLLAITSLVAVQIPAQTDSGPVNFNSLALCPSSSAEIWESHGQPYPCIPISTQLKFKFPVKSTQYTAVINGETIAKNQSANSEVIVNQIKPGLNEFKIFAQTNTGNRLISRELFIGITESNKVHSLNSPTKRMIVRLASNANRSQFISKYLSSGNVTSNFNNAFNGFLAEISNEKISELLSEPDLISLELDRIINTTVTQNNPVWGLDRIDQSNLPLSNNYTYDFDGTGVDIYVIDSGIKTNHSEFTGRIPRSVDFTGLGTVEDCDGHGTHVSATAMGTNYGVAKDARVIPVRVFDCEGSASFSTIISGIDWVIQDHQTSVPAVVNMSLGGSFSSQVNTAVQNLINDGLVTVVAAGNEADNACNYSPASAPNAITVGATTILDQDPVWSNVGSCVDLFAPGENILSATIGDSINQTEFLSGTSMASPHVAGVAALLLEEHFASITNKTTANQVIRDLLVDNATSNVLTSVYGTFTPGSSFFSANKLLFSRSTGAELPPVAPSATGTISLSGNFIAGDDVVAAGLTWSGYPDPDLEYSWYGCTRRDTSQRINVSIPTDCALVEITSDATYEIEGIAAGRYLRVEIAGQNSSGTFKVLSATSRNLINGAPVNTVAPTITGTPSLNSTLRGTAGTWVANPRSSNSLQWLQCTAADNLASCANIARATSTSLRLTTAHGGFHIRLAVTARNNLGSATSYSAATEPVFVPPAAPTFRGTLSIRGTARVGQSLSTTTLTWSGYPVPEVTKSWARCTTRVSRQTTSTPATCSLISGANQSTYNVTSDDVGFYLILRESATNSSATVSVWSASTARPITN